MKKIEFFVKNSEHDALEEKKGSETWRVAVLKRFDVPATDIPLGRPPQAAMDDLFQFKTEGTVSHGSPVSSETPPSNSEIDDEMSAIYAPWTKEKKKEETEQ